MTPFFVETLSLVATCIAVAGVVLNNCKLRTCFAVWLVSNALSAVIHLDAHLWGLCARDSIFLLLAVHGWIRWGRSKA
jgi:nicotinamide riboside transporter PnuC